MIRNGMILFLNVCMTNKCVCVCVFLGNLCADIDRDCELSAVLMSAYEMMGDQIALQVQIWREILKGKEIG